MTTATEAPASRFNSEAVALARRIAAGAPAGRCVSVDAVCDLIEAAGPLTVRDIAGGLDVPLRQASASVHRLARSNCLKQDEFRRYRLTRNCAS
jgi:hypothetical protein